MKIIALLLVADLTEETTLIGLVASVSERCNNLPYTGFYNLDFTHSWRAGEQKHKAPHIIT